MNTDSQPRNGSLNPGNVLELYRQLQEQQDEIEQLKADLRTAIDAYRALLREK
jgi:hypothetical protein